MKSGLTPMLLQASQGQYGVAAFNMLNYVTTLGIIKAAESCSSPVIVQTSVATVKSIGAENLIRMVRPMIEAANVPVTLHLDHCQSVEMCKHCIDLGWDSIMFDGSHLSLKENIEATNEVRRYAVPRGVNVEGEVGIIAGTEDDISHDIASLAGFDETMHYIEQTKVDAIAPAVGTAHGVYRGTPKINYDLLKRLKNATPCPIVIHGGTGLEDSVFRHLISLGASKINISTALKQVYLQSLRAFLAANPDCSNPLRLDKHVEESVVEMVSTFFHLFGSANKARTPEEVCYAVA